jgi:hypothetical protein
VATCHEPPPSSAQFAVCDALIDHEIAVAIFDIKAAPWARNVELAKLLISKRMGLRICASDRSVKLKSEAAAMKAQGRNAFDLLAA